MAANKLQVTIFSESELRKQLVADIGCGRCAGGREGALFRIVADYVRHILSYSGQSAAVPIHVHQIRASVSRQLGCLFPDFDRPPWFVADDPVSSDPGSGDAISSAGASDIVLTALRGLVQIGDCAHLGGGYYLAAPTRAVPLMEGGALLISGLPTRDLKKLSSGTPVSWAGLARITSKTKVNGIPVQELRTWMALPKMPLRDWTAGIIATAKERSTPSTGTDTTVFEVYSPRQQRQHQQTFRWIPASQWQYVALSGTDWWLCRSRAVPRRYWLAHGMEYTGGLTYDRDWTVKPSQIRRLMYGLDELADASVSAKVSPLSERAAQYEVQLSSWPAWEEYQLLTSLAMETTIFGSRRLPMKLHVGSQWLSEVSTTLQGLGIGIRHQTRST